jgi:nucleoside-diphosphate-sugar epimerase
MEILIIGGTRNIGYLLVLELLKLGHHVTVFNRGITPHELPMNVQRLYGDRSDPTALAMAVGRRSFDAVVDMALYKGQDAKNVSALLEGRVGRYIFVSTGQVYLVRQGPQRPFLESDYENPLTEEPPQGSRDYEEWLYGVEKSQAEDALMEAFERRKFPVTTLRLPMVNSERDHFHRIYNYLLRLQDGGPILLPTGEHLRLRHVYGEDVIQAITRVIESNSAKGRVYNISQEETLSIEEFLNVLAQIAQCELKLVHVPRNMLEELALFPGCSPFSDPWMSELDNSRSKSELGIQYTPVSVYLRKLVSHYRSHVVSIPTGYERRHEEIELAKQR